MSQRGPSGYGVGGPSYGAAPSSDDSSGNFLDQLRPYTTKVEDVLESVSEPVKP